MDELVLASWSDRFWAWLIDVLLMGLIWHRVVLVLGIDPMHLDAMLILSGLIFVYWTALEGYVGNPWERCCSISWWSGPMERPSALGIRLCSPLARPFSSPSTA